MTTENRFLTLLHNAVHDDAPIMIDGAMGTMLMAAGLMFGDPPDQWNVLPDKRDKVRSVYRGYLQAGSQLILTNSFGGTSYRLKMHNLQDQVFEINKAAAALAREEAGDRVVAGSIGPTGELFEPMGALTYAGAVDAFAAQAEGLAAGGADVLWVETMSDLSEVRAAIEGAQRAAPHLPVACTMTFDTRGFTMMGISPTQAMQELASLNITALGGNCGNGPDELETVIYSMRRENPDLPLIAKSNAGMPVLVNGKTTYVASPEVMGHHAKRFRALGARLIGGCCGNTPVHIAAMRQALFTEAPLDPGSVHITVDVAERKTAVRRRKE
ncbi:MAG: homocysteine S-methyltransferase family protein [Chloroflexi bacterium]|nr:homocysteine S-methyltransferase family protein [Chloroflexota bacterium]